MFALKSFGAMGSLGSMGSMGSLGGLGQNNLLNSTYLLYDLKKTKSLNGSMAETYKSFIYYMKSNEIPVTFDNLLNTLDSYIKKYNTLNISVSTLSKYPKIKKEVEKLKGEYLKDVFITVFKQSFLSVGLSLYYLYKSTFIESFQTKIKFSVLILLGLSGFFGYIYYTSSKKNHLEESNKRVKALYEDLKSESANFDISQIIISGNTGDGYNVLLSELISEVNTEHKELDNNKQIKCSVTNEISYTITNNLIDISSNDINDIIMSDIRSNDINSNDTESIIDIILSPHSDKIELCQIGEGEIKEELVHEVTQEVKHEEITQEVKHEEITQEVTHEVKHEEVIHEVIPKVKTNKKTEGAKKVPVKKTVTKKTQAKKSSAKSTKSKAK
jgi:hypothetical protein